MEKLLQDMGSNLGFLGSVAVIIAIIFVLAKLAEHFLPNSRRVKGTRRITIISICAAIAAILHILDFPLLFIAPEFYKLDFSELPVMLCGFYLGPSAAVVCEALKILLKLLLKGTSTAFVGDFANFVVGCSMVLPALIVYHIKKSRATAIWGLALGTVILTAFGSAFNALYLLPKFAEMFMPMEAIIGAGTAIHSSIDSVWSLVLICVVPLNLIKGIAVSLLTMLLYKRVARPLFSL
ncbi:MAG: ECF transporter S component [Oscillospiraceae bacterium]|nr:ECF transporter S component [Oscillospiraceae bacterium]